MNNKPGEEKINCVAEAMAVCALPVKPRDLDNVSPNDLKRIVHALAEKLVIERENTAALLPAAETLLFNKRAIGKQFLDVQAAVEKIRAQRKLVQDARHAAGIG